MNALPATHQIPAYAARLRPEDAARIIGCQPHDIPVLVRRGLLTPLGRPPANAVKYFSRSKVLELCGQESWLAQVSDALVHHWQRKNSGRSPVGSVAVESPGMPRRPAPALSRGVRSTSKQRDSDPGISGEAIGHG